MAEHWTLQDTSIITDATYKKSNYENRPTDEQIDCATSLKSIYMADEQASGFRKDRSSTTRQILMVRLTG